MSRSIRHHAASVGLLTATTVLLTGCSALQAMVGGVEPVRDETTGEVVEAVQADALALQVGDCLNVLADLTEETQMVDSVPTVPCADAHDSEIYASHQMQDAEYPGDEDTAGTADELCYGGFQEFVGLAYDDSTLDFTTFFPSSDSWEMADDREILCIVVDPAGGVTGTLEGAQR